MPEVGVLNLSIRDNSEQAVEGLDSLCGALERVKGAIPKNGFGLSSVAKELNTFAKQIAQTKSSMNVLKTVAEFGDGMKKLASVANIEFNTDKITTGISNLKEAIGDGMHLGQAGTQMKNLRDALTKDWGDGTGIQVMRDLHDVVKAFGDGGDAGKVKDLSNAVEEYSKSLEKMNEVSKTAGDWRMGMAEQGKHSSMLKVDLQRHAAKTRAVTGGEQMKMELDEIIKGTEGEFERVDSAIVKAKESLEGFNIMMHLLKNTSKETSENISSSVSNDLSQYIATPIEHLMQRYRDCEAATQAFGDKFTAVLPKINEAGVQATISSKYIEALVNRLNTDIKYKGLREMVDQLTGVNRNFLDAEESAKTFIKYWREIAKVEEALDSGATAKNSMVDVSSETVSKIADDVQKINSPEMMKPASNQTVFSSIEEAAQAAGVSVDEIKQKLAETYAFVYGNKPSNNEMTVFSSIEEAAKAMGVSVEEAKRKCQETLDMIGMNNQIQTSINNTANVIENAKEAAAKEDSFIPLDQFLQTYSHIDSLKAKLSDLEKTFDAKRKLGLLDSEEIDRNVVQIKKLREEIAKLISEEEEASSVSHQLKAAFGELGNGVKKMFPTLTSYIKKFASVMKNRIVRTVIKHISEGFQEGVENVYNYSKAVGTTLAPAMNAAATSLQQMKNSIGAAVAPIIQALVPVLQTVVNWFITLVNYANQFFALMNGQSTWTRALPEQAEAFESSAKSAKGASKAMKDLLADWDELNIIQSETGSGGGGGSGKTAQEYSEMFEEVSEFDEKIKDVLQFIDDYLGGIWGLVKKIGIAILGWKISKAFDGILGKLGKLIAGGALLVLGIELAYGGGYEAGKKGYFDGDDILATVGGVFADAIGGSLIGTAIAGPAGGAVGFAVGIGVGIVATLVGWVEGQKYGAAAAKWGNLSKTREEIENDVKKQFSFDVDALINVLDAAIENERAARANVNGKISEFAQSLAIAQIKIGMGVDHEEASAAVQDAYADAQEAIAAVQNLITTNNDGLQVLLKEFKFVNDDNEDITEDLLSSITIADTTLKDYMTGIGEDMAKWMYEGQKSGWKNGEMEQLLELMESQKRIYEKAAEYEESLVTDSEIKRSVKAAYKNGVIDIDTAMEQVEVQKEKLDEVAAKARQHEETLRDNYYYLAGLAKAAAEEAGLDTETGKALNDAAQRYIDAATIIDEKIDTAVSTKLEETKKKMAAEWQSLLSIVYGEDFNKYAAQYTSNNASLFNVDFFEALFDPLGNAYTLESGFKKHGIKDTADAIRDLLTSMIMDSDFSGAATFYFNELGGRLFDVLTEESKQTMMDNLVSALGNEYDAVEVFKQIFDIPEGDVEKYIAGTVKDTMEDIQDVVDSIDEEIVFAPMLTIDPVTTEEDVDIWDLTGRKRFGHIAAGGMSDMGMGRPTLLGTPEDTTAIAKSQEEQTNRFFGSSGKVKVEDSDVSNGVKEGTAMGFQTLSAKLDMLSKLDTTNQLLRQIARAGMAGSGGTAASVGFGIMQGLNAVDRVIG